MFSTLELRFLHLFSCSCETSKLLSAPQARLQNWRCGRAECCLSHRGLYIAEDQHRSLQPGCAVGSVRGAYVLRGRSMPNDVFLLQ